MENLRFNMTGTLDSYNIAVSDLKALFEPQAITDVVIDALMGLYCKDYPNVFRICSQFLTKILSGSKRAKSDYFCKRDIFRKFNKVIGAVLENQNHWTLFFCDISKRQLTYMDSLGESEERKRDVMKNWRNVVATAIKVAGKQLVAYVYSGKGRKRNLPETLRNLTKKANTKVSIFSALTEGEASDLASGLSQSLCRTIEPQLVRKHITDEDTEVTRKTLGIIREELKSNLHPTSDFSLLTHTFGPRAVDGVLGFL
ncbi:uncharacterized protein LOC121899839 [Thunnus maccoyii]|uniref:uncharacterized protein LOC121899839 n=1 Tax=Thunnus maccoyii TaxID=8240 RepID=UPI001C4D99CD|nr:uncharacterized protein LOC121899839 [Thunnus maccoyii]